MSSAVKKVEAGEVIVTKQELPSQFHSEAAALISMIERAAKDPNVDIVKMERLFEMHQKVLSREAVAAFNAAMAEAQAELKPVARKLYNTQTKSRYADLAAISDAADPIIHKHGFGVIASEFQSAVPNHLGIRCKITHKGGHSESYDFNVPVDGTGMKGNANKTATHAYGSTITYGRRYAKCSVFDIATKNDNDGNAPPADDELVSAEQAEAISKKITEVGANIDAFLKLGNVESVSDIKASEFDKVMQLLEMKKQAAKK